MLNVQGPSVEKGLSASSYFDQFGSGTESTAGGDDNANSSVFEAFAQSDTAEATNPTDAQIADQAAVATVTDETIEWYKTQLEQYQQAINDWQIWSQSQMDEVAKLKVCTHWLCAVCLIFNIYVVGNKSKALCLQCTHFIFLEFF